MVKVSFPRTAQKSHLGENQLHGFRPTVRCLVMDDVRKKVVPTFGKHFQSLSCLDRHECLNMSEP